MKDMLTIIYTSKNGICTTTEFMQYLQYVYKGNKAIFCKSIICMYIRCDRILYKTYRFRSPKSW